jgi:hypothetical protein
MIDKFERITKGRERMTKVLNDKTVFTLRMMDITKEMAKHIVSSVMPKRMRLDAVDVLLLLLTIIYRLWTVNGIQPVLSAMTAASRLLTVTFLFMRISLTVKPITMH